jgi:hypothetical protein
MSILYIVALATVCGLHQEELFNTLFGGFLVSIVLFLIIVYRLTMIPRHIIGYAIKGTLLLSISGLSWIVTETNCTKYSIIPYLFGHSIWHINPYSVLTPPGGVLGFLKIKHSTDIFLFIACKIRKYLIFIQKTRNMTDAVRVNVALGGYYISLLPVYILCCEKVITVDIIHTQKYLPQFIDIHPGSE